MKHRSTKQLAGIMATVMMFSAVSVPGIASEPIFFEQEHNVNDEIESPEKGNSAGEDTIISGEERAISEWIRCHSRMVRTIQQQRKI